MATRVAVRWCKFSPAAMSNTFVQRGGWWVVGQFLLIFAINILFESMLESQAGVIFYAFFNVLFFTGDGNKQQG